MKLHIQHLTGFIAGLGVSAFGYYLYRKNQSKVDRFLGDLGFPVSEPTCTYSASQSLEELVRTKESIEDAIAEKEAQADSN